METIIILWCNVNQRRIFVPFLSVLMGFYLFPAELRPSPIILMLFSALLCDTDQTRHMSCLVSVDTFLL